MNHGCPSESTGPTDGWSCVLLEWLHWLQRSPHPQLRSVGVCSVSVVVVVGCGVVEVAIKAVVAVVGVVVVM